MTDCRSSFSQFGSIVPTKEKVNMQVITWGECQYMQMKNNQEDYSEVCVVKVLFFVSSNLLTKIKLNLCIGAKHHKQEKSTCTSKNDENSTWRVEVFHFSSPYEAATNKQLRDHCW